MVTLAWMYIMWLLYVNAPNPFTVYDSALGLLCFYFYLSCYAAVLINFTYYAQYYAHVKDLCLSLL